MRENLEEYVFMNTWKELVFSDEEKGRIQEITINTPFSTQMGEQKFLSRFRELLETKTEPTRIGQDGRVLPVGAAAVPLLGPPPRGPSLTRRRPHPYDERVSEPEPEPEPTSSPTHYIQPESRPHGGGTG